MGDISKKRLSVAKAVGACAGAMALSVALAACGQTSQGGDSGYDVAELAAPNTTEAYDGSSTSLPEGYVPALTRDMEDGESHEYKVEQQFEVDGTSYTVHAPSNVHASATTEGMDSFLLKIDVTPPEDGLITGQTMFYSPDGLYSYDMVERAVQEEASIEYEKAVADASAPEDAEDEEAVEGDEAAETEEAAAEGEEAEAETTEEGTNASQDAIESIEDKIRAKIPDGSDGKPFSRTYEIPYMGDGKYTVAVKDFVHSTLSYVTFEIKLNTSGN